MILVQPSTILAELPNAINSRGRTFAAEVYAVVGSRKRKRSELAVAIDGESVNIYGIQSSKLITGYAVSPQTSFTCPPLSVRVKHLENGSISRSTYCSTQGPTSRIQCFVEAFDRRLGRQSQISTSDFSITGTKSPVVHLDLIGGSKNDADISARDLLVIHEDGEIRCLSEDLSEEYWSSNIKNTPLVKDPLREIYILCAATLSIDQARKALLKSRGDVLAMLEADLDSTKRSSAIPNLLVLISSKVQSGSARIKSSLRIHLFNVSTTKSSSSNSRSAGSFKSMKELVASWIPEPTCFSARKSVCSLDEGNGQLHQHGGNDLVIYNLTGAIPRIEQHITLDHQIASCLRLGPSTTAVMSSTTIFVLDTQYHSIHSSQSLETKIERSKSIQRKGQVSVNTNTRLSSFFSNLDLVVGFQGQALVTFQLKEPKSSQSSGLKRTRGGTLLSAIGRGINISRSKTGTTKTIDTIPNTLGDKFPSSRNSKDWQEKRSKLDLHAAKGEVELFDRLMSSELGVNLDDENLQIVDASIEHMRFTNLGQTAFSNDRQKITYALSKIFIFDRQWNTDALMDRSDPPMLKIGILPPTTFRWLASNGLVSLQQIETALRHAGTLPIPATLGSNSMIQAFINFDHSLETLVSILTGPTYLKPEEVVTALRLSIQILRKFEDEEGIRTITVGRSGIDHDFDLIKQVTSNETSNSRTSPITKTSKTLDHRAFVKVCIKRLNQYHSSAILNALKHHLPRDDLVSLITHLRMDLAHSGWLSRYTDDLPIAPLHDLIHSDFNSQIGTTAKILNCAIDALGTAGWMLGDSASPDSSALAVENGGMVSYMKAEISAALEGIEEAAYLQGMLSETLLFCKSTGGRSPDQEDMAQRSKKVKPITVPLEDELAGALPLGMKAPARVSLTKIGAGGEVQVRGAREVGRLKSRMVGKYSFERIIL